MASMRVHELAKEFGMSSKELLDRLQEMKIPAKSHASMLADAYVAKIRKNLEPEIKQRAGQLEDKEAAALAEEQRAQAEKKAEEERKRREAVEEERKRREAERARRMGDAPASSDSQGEASSEDASDERAANPAPASSAFQKLASQIESEKERVAREAEEAKARARAAIAAKEVAKKQAVAEALAARKSGGKGAKQSEGPKKAPVLGAKPKSSFDSLLSQIESEKARIEQQKSERQSAPRQGAANQQRQKPQRTDAKKQATPKQGQQKRFEPEVPELVDQASGEDRYAQMAVQAEKLQRDKVLAEARAAVEAATQEGGEGRRKKRKEKREAENRERLELEAIEKGLDPTLVLDDSVVEVPQGTTVSKFAELLGVAPNDIIKRLFMLGQVLTLTQSMGDDLIELIADDMGRKVRVVSPEEEYAVVYHDRDEDLKPRPPVVTVMGHVDHGKTSLLDAIRHTGVVESEAGGITQHIGASVVEIDGRQITFIDTPGHEAFTAMRARGAQVTDVIVLVVAADDGVMPQTIEAINHAKAAEVPIVVAVNKIDKPGANPDRVRQELTEYGVIPEEWGGTNMFVEVSAKQKLHIDDLLETILLQADVLELKANPDAFASGFVIEANLDKGRGPVATVLVHRGTLRPGDSIVAGSSYGRVRALVNPRGAHVEAAYPADPVEILGLNSVPTAGDEFRVFEDERDARKLAEERALRMRLAEQETKSHMSLDDLFSRIEEGKQTDLNLIVKADVQGSIEALRDAFDKMDQSEVRINIVHSAVGGITETDVTLASASDAIIIGFNVRPTGKSKVQAEKEKVDIRLYRVIYQAIEEINAARVGLLSPDIVEEDTGIAEVRETFKVPKAGTIAGCYIVEGEISRDDKVRVVRDGTVVFEGTIDSLRRFKDDVKSVRSGYECGIGITGYQDIKIGDTIEGYKIVEVERTE
ncbi:translation initiation factor IF-2 [Raoultibacter phocaeensis]|uniref:translation initiation factor IF-2 n=1 Tax=Raoultibacter phocaeensis TaxID=2479841 RepID=UPI00111A5CB4|nr:translation initiation factor IF-2 [Raoultibacter phocaeensis]